MSLIRQGGDKMLFTTPKRPLKLKLKLLERVALHWDWQLGAQRYVLGAHEDHMKTGQHLYKRIATARSSGSACSETWSGGSLTMAHDALPMHEQLVEAHSTA